MSTRDDSSHKARLMTVRTLSFGLYDENGKWMEGGGRATHAQHNVVVRSECGVGAGSRSHQYFTGNYRPAGGRSLPTRRDNSWEAAAGEVTSP